MHSKMIYKYLMIFVCTCTCMVYWIPYACNDFYNHFIETYQITYQQAGTLLSFFGVTSVIGYFVGGWVADRFHPKKLVVLSAVLTGIAGTVVAFSSDFRVLCVMFLVFGVTSVCMHWSAFLKVIKNIGEDEEQGRLFGFYNFSFGAFGLVCTYLLLLAMETFLAKWEFRAGMMIYCVISIVAGILTWILVPYDEEKARARADADDAIDFKLVLKVLKMPITWYLGLFTLGYFLIRSTVPYLNPYLTSCFGVSVGVAAFLTNTLRSGMNLVAGPISGFAIDKLKGSTRIVVAGSIGTLLLTVGLMLVPRGNSYVALLVGVCVVLLFFSYFNSTALYTPMTEAKVPFQYVGTVLGIASCIGYSSDLWVYNLVGNWLDELGDAGYLRIWILQAAGALMMLVFGLLLGRLYKRAAGRQEKKHEN